MKFLDCVIVNPKISLKKGKVYPFIEMANVSTSYREPLLIEYKSFDSGAKFQDGDTVIARITPCLQNGKRFYCKNIGTGFGSTEYLVFRPKNKLVNNLFLYYFMQTEFIKLQMINSMVGATGRQRVNNNVFNDIELNLPDIKIQKNIGKTLSAYDDLIENNQKQIKLLEEAAQRLYKEWFVDLRFPGNEKTPIIDGVPEGWNINRADFFYDITIGKTPSRNDKQCFVKQNIGVPWVSISDMGNINSYVLNTAENLTREAVKKYNVKVVPPGTILLSFKLTVGRVAITSTEMCTNEAIAHFYINYDYQRTYTYFYLKNFKYNILGNTSAISKAVNSQIIKAMPVIMPKQEVIKEFSGYVTPILEQIKNKQILCLKLTEARDRLLTKLMSGEIEV